MRRWVLPALAAVLLIPLAAAALEESTLSSDAPVGLTGRVAVTTADAVAYHHAHHVGTLEAQVHVGTVYRHLQQVAHETRCSAHSMGPTSDVVAEADIDEDPAQKFTLKLAAAALSRIEFPEGFDLGSDGSKRFELGPNPYLRETQQAITLGAVPPWFAAAFPQSGFVLVPSQSVDLVGHYRLQLQWGSLLAYPSGSGPARQFEARYWDETHPSSNDLPDTPITRQPSCDVRHVEWYSVDAAVGTLHLEQEGIERTQRFWDGEDVGKAVPPSGVAPPQGYWDRKEAATFGDALDQLLLPITLWELPQGKVEATSASFERAVGSVAIGPRLYDASFQSAVAKGNLRLQGIEADDESRRMLTGLQGVTEFLVAGRLEGGWGEYVPAFALAGGLAGGLGFLYVWPGLKFWSTKWALFPLYARLRKEDILENPLRDDILAVVEGSPGISASDLGRRLSCGWGTLVYHLTVLERMQLISSAREGRHRRFFVQGRINYSDKDAVALLANPHARNILDAIRDQPGLIQRDLSRTLGLSAGTVAWHVERMAQTGLVVKEEEGRVVRYYPSQKLLELTKQLAA